jgi:ribonucleoside-diphosphate reductase alpha chain
VRRIIEELEGIGGSRTLGFGKNSVKSLPDAVAKVLAMHYSLHNTENAVHSGKNGAAETASTVSAVSAMAAVHQAEAHAVAPVVVAVQAAIAPKRKVNFDLCPKCGEASLVHEEGCKKCYGCGYSAC